MRSFRETPVGGIERALAARWSKGVALRALGGYLGRNQVFADDALDLVVKVFHHQPLLRAHREATIARGLGGRGLPIARLLDHGVFDDGAPWIAVQRLAGTPLEPQRPDMPQAVIPHLYADLGRLCAGLHEAKCPAGLHRQDKGRKYARARAKVLAADRPPGPLLAAAAARMLELQDRVARPQRPVVVHGGFSGRNLLVLNADAEPRITGLVDFEMAHLGDPMADVAKVALKEFSDPRSRVGFLNGYFAGRRPSLSEVEGFEYHLLGLAFEICNWAWGDDRPFYDQAVDMLARTLDNDPIFRLEG
ncbi:MAG: aminoglycoside phosphotransferase family protein [Phenylobacterium sp.]|nr:aminoglycoside phosphotransferase family protein [Phenylobacterium sp.]